MTTTFCQEQINHERERERSLLLFIHTPLFLQLILLLHLHLSPSPLLQTHLFRLLSSSAASSYSAPPLYSPYSSDSSPLLRLLTPLLLLIHLLSFLLFVFLLLPSGQARGGLVTSACHLGSQEEKGRILQRERRGENNK